MTLYYHPVPEHLLSRLPDLYHTHHTTENSIHTVLNIHAFDAIAVNMGELLVHFIPFVRSGHSIQFLCPQIRISGSELDSIAAFLFDSFPKVTGIRVPPVKIEADAVQITHRLCGFFDNFEVKLPDTLAQYRGLMSKHFLRTLKQHINRLERDHPNARFQVFQNGEISEDAAHRIVKLNHDRMRQFNKVSSIKEREESQILQLARRQGFLSALIVDDQIIAGTIGYNTGNTCHIDINAFDISYAHLGPGVINCYRIAEYAIARGARTLCLGPGDYRYKRDLGGRPQTATSLILFRSNFHAIISLEVRLRRLSNAWERCLLRMKFRLKKYQRLRLFMNKVLSGWQKS